MLTTSQLMSGVLWMVGLTTILTIVLLLFMIKHPKYIILAYDRFSMIKYGISRKKLKTKKHVFSYMERGSTSDPTIFLLHGFSSSKELYFNIFKYLPKKYHLIAIDLPGHGDTPLQETNICIEMFVNAVNEFVEKMGLHEKKFHLLGMSMGGHVAGVYSAQYPHHIKSLCLMSPHGIDHGQNQNQINEEATQLFKFKLLPQTVEELREMFNLATYKKVDIPDIFLTGVLHLRLEKNDFFKRLGEALIEPENRNMLEKNLHNVHSPTFVVWGKEDNVLHVDCVDVIKRKLPKPPKKVVIFDNVGHIIINEQPRKFIFAFVEFLNSLE